MIEIRRDGRTFPSNAVLGGRYSLRACFMNHRTEADVVDDLVDAAVSLGPACPHHRADPDGDLAPRSLRYTPGVQTGIGSLLTAMVTPFAADGS